MYDLNTIKELNWWAGNKAKSNKLQPLIATCDKDPGIFRCPDLGNHTPKGWKEMTRYFVDNSGLGSFNEPALTSSQFLERVKEGKGYAIVESGQFQVYIGEFIRIPKK